MTTRPNDTVHPIGGLTKREHFAALAMEGILASWPAHLGVDVNYTAGEARRAADALIAALNEEPEQ